MVAVAAAAAAAAVAWKISKDAAPEEDAVVELADPAVGEMEEETGAAEAAECPEEAAQTADLEPEAPVAPQPEAAAAPAEEPEPIASAKDLTGDWEEIDCKG